MARILGMVKRNLDLRGAKAPKLELDFLRLAYAAKELRKNGDARGYLLAMTPEVAQRVRTWQTKYGTGDCVVIGTAELSESQRGTICLEIEANTAGMLAGTLGDDTCGKSCATEGRDWRRLLRQFIESREPGIRRSLNAHEFPLGIRWDYYGTM